MTDHDTTPPGAPPSAEAAEPTEPADAARARAALLAVRAEVAKAVVGQDAAVAGLLVALLCRGHILLEGVPGVAKTLLVRSLAGALDLGTKRVQFTPDLMPGDLTGSLVFDARDSDFTFRPGPVFTNLAPRRRDQPHAAQDAVGAARGDGGAPGQRRRPAAPPAVPLHGRRDAEPRRVRGHLPPARGPARPLPPQGRPAAARAPRRGAGAAAARRRVRPARPRRRRHPTGGDGRGPRGRAWQRCGAWPSPTRWPPTSSTSPGPPGSSPSLALGVSPRGATALMATSRAWAWLGGRSFVTPDDVKALAHATLAHRLSLRPEAELEGVGVAAVLDSALGSVPVPR